MTVIEITPYKWGWRVFEAPGVEPVFLEKDQAIGYAETRARLRTGEIQFSIRLAERPPHAYSCRSNAGSHSGFLLFLRRFLQSYEAKKQ
jgi:hypothetical protein